MLDVTQTIKPQPCEASWLRSELVESHVAFCLLQDASRAPHMFLSPSMYSASFPIRQKAWSTLLRCFSITISSVPLLSSKERSSDVLQCLWDTCCLLSAVRWRLRSAEVSRSLWESYLSLLCVRDSSCSDSVSFCLVKRILSASRVFLPKDDWRRRGFLYTRSTLAHDHTFASVLQVALTFFRSKLTNASSLIVGTIINHKTLSRRTILPIKVYFLNEYNCNFMSETALQKAFLPLINAEH